MGYGGRFEEFERIKSSKSLPVCMTVRQVQGFKSSGSFGVESINQISLISA